MPTQDIISTEEACKLLDLTRQTLYKLVDKGQIPGRKFGSRYKFSKSTILEYVNKNNSAPSGDYRIWEVQGDFATAGIKKMARRTFQEIASNIEELIVNAYDGDATLVQVVIDYDKKTLSVVDDGNGMDEKSLESYVIYGESNKSSSYKSPKFGRPPIGEYGIGGKLAITNLCKVCKIITRKSGKEHIFNMDVRQLEQAKYVSEIKSKVYTKKCDLSTHGTSLFMEELTTKNMDSDRLIDRFASKMPRSHNFKIVVSLIRGENRQEMEIQEPAFEYIQKFDFSGNLPKVGIVNLVIFYTKEPVPKNKQGIWTKVNGRVVNEKQEWFGLLNMHSGQRYRWRMYGYGEADGLKDFVTFSKNDFVDCPEYREYYDFVQKSIQTVQDTLLKTDENAKKEQDRNIVKEVEKEVNDIVSKLDDPKTLGDLESKIKKELTREIEGNPDVDLSDPDKIQEEVEKAALSVKKVKENREKRTRALPHSEKLVYSGKGYTVQTVDMSEKGDLVAFTKDKSLIEINEKHPFYSESSRGDYLQNFVRDVALTQIANDYSDGNPIIFNKIYNELARLTVQLSRKQEKRRDGSALVVA